jgi:hypothetical protein
MATEESKIVVSVERGTFKSSLKGMEREVAASGTRMKSSLSGAFSAGMGNVKNSIKGIFSGIGQHMKTAMTFGGAIGAGVLIKDALQLQTLYRNIAYNMGKMPGQAMKWQDVQALVSRTVANTGAKAEDLAAAFGKIAPEIGNLEGSKKTLEAIGILATATGGSIDTFSDVAIRAVEKFKISTDRLPEAMSQFESLTGIGGPALDDLGRRFGMMAGAASDAGFTGEEGMRSLLNIMNQVDDLIGDRAEPALKRFFEVFRVGGKDIKDLEKKMGGKFAKGMGAKEKLESILAKGGAARTELESKLSGDMMLAFKQMVPAFDNTLKEALAAGKTKQEATALAVEAFDRSITGADKKTRSYAENLEAATKRFKEDPALQLQKAMNKLQEVMTSPKALESIKKLMDVLPPLAEKMAKLLEFIIEHPFVTGGLAVGGKLGMSFLGGYGSKFLDNSFSGGGKGGAKGGIPMVPPSAEKMKMSGASIGQGAVGVIAAAGIGYSIGTVISEMITAAGEEISKKQIETLNKLSGRGGLSKEVAGVDLSTEEGRKKAGELKKKLKSEESAAVKRVEGEGFWSRLKRDMLSVMSGGGTGGEAFKEESRAITSMQNIIARAESDAARQEYFNKLMKSADSASKALDKVGGKDVTGGHGTPPKKGKQKPGADVD